MSRPPSPPPVLDGFTYVQHLGAGGFADVFLYEQEMPRRRVAVKVLLADRISSASAQEFADEANVMAMLSTHPAIVTIYQAGVAGDGRPYLVMEYCPRPNLQIRARKEPFSVAEALRVGVQVAGAVETAHRAGVLHRDIKPANILVTEYNRPALTDFGIASTSGAANEAAGMSIPWSPPESFGDPPQGGARSDVYALGATVYTLLAGRSPFERQGERNSSADLIERIERSPVPALNRVDSPASLQRLLERAMAKDSADRFPSAVAFARALQKVQIELSHSVTPIDIVDEHPIAEEKDEDDGLTRVKQIVSIEPDDGRTRPSATTRPFSNPRPPSTVPSGPSFISVPPTPSVQTEVDDATLMREDLRAPAAAAYDPDDRTLMRAPRVVAPDGAPAAPGVPLESPPPAPAAAPVSAQKPSRRRVWWAVAGVAVAAAVIIGFLALNNMVASLTPEPEATADVVPQDVVGGAVSPVADLFGTRSGGTVTFSWTNQAAEDGDAYIWSRVTLSGSGSSSEVVTEPTVSFAAEPGEVCIDVVLRRVDGRASEPVRGCVP